MTLISNFDVPVSQWGSPESSRFGIIVFHGMTEHIGRYAMLGEWVVANGGCLIGADHLGHGATHRGRLGDLGPDGWSALIDRNIRLVDAVMSAAPSIPWFILGHSMGTFVAMDLVSKGRPGIKGLILTGGGYESKLRVGYGCIVATILGWMLGPAAKATLIYNLSYGEFNRPFKPTRTLFDWLSRKQSVVDSYIADPLCGFVPPVSYYQQVFGGIYRLFSRSFFRGFPRIPILMMSGGNDSVTQNGRNCHRLAVRFKDAGKLDVQVSIFEGLRHVILDEIDDEAVYATLGDWLARRGSDTVKVHST